MKNTKPGTASGEGSLRLKNDVDRQKMISNILSALPRLSCEHIELVHRFTISLRDGCCRPR